jgi:alpha-tubulin suppressor-like RCC1 family protein
VPSAATAASTSGRVTCLSAGPVVLAAGPTSSVFREMSLDGRSVKSSACGWGHVLCVASDGSVWGWGENDRGQCGVGVPKLIESPLCTFREKEIVRTVACGLYHSLLGTARGQVFGCGDNRFGQVDPSSSCKHLNEWTRLAGVPEIALCTGALCCGQRHSIAVLKGATSLLVWGDNRWGQHGHCDSGAVSSSMAPSATGEMAIRASSLTSKESRCDLTGGEIVSVASGWSHVLVLAAPAASLDSSVLFAWGRNDMGQCGAHTEERVLPPSVAASHVRAIACGSESSMISTDGETLASGWNEHGNLGIVAVSEGASASSSKSDGEASVVLGWRQVDGLPAGRIVCGGATVFAIDNE